ncbi:polysaccharide biosynthesis/export family protein [Donghicola mangrovi]|uniref:Soluble ligand binding domain-containing protein n=1 Tax=Donghicola mangrovi TaxID=2729614 RepID=A0A850Q647_9RHOB|nr:polysaccharide biosynthesis/export family protein [Donghicola mangrovi]NVO25217.1 hypothetical protein [Donghicola mangrovi]
MRYSIGSKFLRVAGVAIATLATCVSASAAESYRLVAGDSVQLMYSGLGAPIELTIDINGQVRVVNVGGVTIAGLTMDEAEKKLEKDIIESGMFIEPIVSLQLMLYAPVMVAGDVAHPGRFDFTAGMTVASALALSGGSELAGISRYELQSTRSDLEAKLKTLNLQIATAVADMARYQAVLDGKDEVVLSDELMAAIPAKDAVDMSAIVTKSNEILSSEAVQEAELMAVWAEEIAAIEQQIVLFGDRIEVQKEIVASAASDLENSRDLQNRGLQTTTRLVAAEQRDADARSKVIELESARILATQSVADAKAQQSTYRTTRVTEALNKLKDDQVKVDTLTLDYTSALEQLAMLTSGSISALLRSDAVELNYVIQGPRADRIAKEGINEETELLPGDTLIVYLEGRDLAPVVATSN